MKILLTTIVLLTAVSCNKAPTGLAEQLKNADSLAFNFYKTGTTDVENVMMVKDSMQLRNIARLIAKGNLVKDICEPSGDLHFFDANQVVFTAFFSISDSCSAISYNYGGKVYNAKLVTEFKNIAGLLNQKTQ